MKMTWPLLLLLAIPLQSWGKDICDVLQIANCPKVMKQARRSSMQALPSTATASHLNPANVSLDRGVGVEIIHQPGNSATFNFISGTGKVGGAFVSSSVENGFFGNRTVETNQSIERRGSEKKQYKSNKLNLAFGARILGKTKNTLDLGIMLKRHKEIKDINPGIGASARLGFLTLGASIYQDDFILYKKDTGFLESDGGYDQAVTGESLTEKFTVQTLSAGLRYHDLSFDYGVIKTKYKEYEEDSNIQLIAVSYAYKLLLFNLARRIETSPAPKFDDGYLVFREDQTSYFGSVQVAVGNHLIVGMAYNYFLLQEVSFNAMLFF